MSKTYTREEIAAKIRALQSKAGRGATEAETAAAVAKAQALMLKYNLDQAAVDNVLKQQELRADIETIDNFDRKTYPLWREYVSQAVAYAFGCQFVRVTIGYGETRYNRKREAYTAWIDQGWNFRLIGTDDNRMVAKLMYDYLVQAVERLADEGLPIAQAEYKAAIHAGARPTYDEWELQRFQTLFPDDKFVVKVGHGKAWKHSFRLGAAERLSERLREQRKASEQGKTRAAYHREREAASQARAKEPRHPWDILLDNIIRQVQDNDEADLWEELAASIEPLDNIQARFSLLVLAARDAGLSMPAVAIPGNQNAYALAVVGMYTELEAANAAKYDLVYGKRVEEEKIKFNHSRTTGANSDSGYKAGQEAGSKIGLNKQLGN